MVSVAIFQHPFTMWHGVGTALLFVGTLAYSLLPTPVVAPPAGAAATTKPSRSGSDEQPNKAKRE